MFVSPSVQRNKHFFLCSVQFWNNWQTMVQFFFLQNEVVYCEVDIIKQARSQTPNQLSRVQTHVSFTWQVSSIPLTSLLWLTSRVSTFCQQTRAVIVFEGSPFPPCSWAFLNPRASVTAGLFTHVKTLFQLWSYSLPLKCIKFASNYKL